LTKGGSTRTRPGEEDAMSNASRYVEELDRAHRQRMIKKVIQEEYNREAWDRFGTNALYMLIFCAVGMAVLFIILPAVYEIWVR
jgi:hypothetical protein